VRRYGVPTLPHDLAFVGSVWRIERLSALFVHDYPVALEGLRTPYSGKAYALEQVVIRREAKVDGSCWGLGESPTLVPVVMN
jgi:hypothetical protein